MTFLVQMRQSDKYESVNNDEIINFHLGSGAGLSASIPTRASPKPHLVIPSPQNKEKAKNH